MNEKIHILLPVHNRRAVTERFVDALSVQSYTNYHLLLIDDGSTDDTDQMVRAKIENTTVLKGNGNWWWAGSLQQGIHWLEKNVTTDQEIVLFANDDITFDADFLKGAVRILDGLHNSLLLPYLRNDETGAPEESGIEANFRDLTFNPAASKDKINCLPTRGLFMRMADLRRIGGFYPRLLPHYWSDYEFTIRAHKKGVGLCTSVDIAISLDRSQTGYRNLEDTKLIVFLEKYFSKRSVANPLYFSSFIILTNSLSDTPINLFNIWRNAALYLVHKLRYILRVRIGRTRIANTVRSIKHDLKVIIGSATTTQSGWISTDYPFLDLTDSLTFSSIFSECSVNNFLAEHVWEHLHPEEAAVACSHCFRYLKKGGLLRIAVPDGFHPDAGYIAHVRPGGCGSGAEDHKVLYNYRTLSALLENSGYKTRLLEWFDEQGKFHYENWDIEHGFIKRSTRFDERNLVNSTTYTSLIIDATKP